MFLKQSRRLPFPAFLQQAVLCLFFFFLLLPAAVFTLRLQLQKMDTNLCETALAHFLATYQKQGAPGLQELFAATPNRKTTFLRLRTENNQLLLLSDIHGRQPTELPNFSRFDLTLNGTWIQPDKQIPEYWTIRTATLPEDVLLQAGVRATDAVLLYTTLKNRLFFTWLLLWPLALLPAWLMSRHNRTYLTGLGQKIVDTALAKSDGNRKRMQLAPGEQGMLEAVNMLTDRHQTLVRQLQETMDNVAHDLRTPLTRLRTIAEYGLQERGDPKQLRERLTDCLEESDRILSMLNTMLNVAEAEAGSMVLNLQAMDLREGIEEVIELYQLVADEKNCVLTVHATKPVIAPVAPNRIGQVWANLIDNAIKYGASRVDIDLKQENGSAVVTIRDNGMGISEIEKEQVWDRLFRGDRSRSQPGLGLGLTLVRATIRAHAGSITLHSRLNSGTIFTVKLPQTPS